MSKRTVWKNRPDGRTVRRNKIAGQWTWWTIEAMESPAYRVVSLSARRVVDRIRIELARHGGKDNGKLPVTFRDFHDYGIHWDAIGPAIREASALGFVRMTQYGIASNAEFRTPSMFALTHLPTDDDQTAATNDWQRIKTIEEAEAIAAAARKAPARYTSFPKKRRTEKTDLSSGNRSEPGSGNRSSTTEILAPETGALSTPETGAPSISRGGAATSTLPLLHESQHVLLPPTTERSPRRADAGLPADDWRIQRVHRTAYLNE
jgi:hypothetical protein